MKSIKIIILSKEVPLKDLVMESIAAALLKEGHQYIF